MSRVPKTALCRAAIVLGLLNSVYCLYRRHEVERTHRTVQLAVDVGEVQSLSDGSGVELAEALSQFAFAGATAAAINEQTLAELRDQGRLEVFVRGPRFAYRDEKNRVLPAYYSLIIITPDEAVYQRVLQSARMRQTPVFELNRDQKAADARALALGLAPSLVEEFGVGFDEPQIEAIRAAKLRPIPRLRNPALLSRKSLPLLLESLRNPGARSVIFAEEEVLGYRDMIPFTAEALQSAGLAFGSVEFARQRGDARLASLSRGQVLRVHSITDRELPVFTPADAEERFVRAVVERNVRICYMRLLRHFKQDSLGASLDYVRRVRDALERRGHETGDPAPLGNYQLPLRYLALTVVGIVAASVMLLNWCLPLSLVAEGVLLGGEARWPSH